jgi:hypothetical protein
MTTKNITLQVNDQRAQGSVDIQEFSEKMRFKRGMLALALGLTLTAASVFIPVLHFFLVPLGLIITASISISRFKTAALIISGEGSCPICNARFRIMKRKSAFPFSDICEGCSRSVVIEILP